MVDIRADDHWRKKYKKKKWVSNALGMGLTVFIAG
jgi:hypothetical protein